MAVGRMRGGRRLATTVDRTGRNRLRDSRHSVQAAVRAARPRRAPPRRLCLDAQRSLRFVSPTSGRRSDAPGRQRWRSRSKGSRIDRVEHSASAAELRRRPRPHRRPRPRRRPRALAASGSTSGIAAHPRTARSESGPSSPRFRPAPGSGAAAGIRTSTRTSSFRPGRRSTPWRRTPPSSCAGSTDTPAGRTPRPSVAPRSPVTRRTRPAARFCATRRASPPASSSTTPRSWSSARSRLPPSSRSSRPSSGPRTSSSPQGLTSVHEMGIAAGVADVYLRLARSGRLKIRVYAHWSADPETLAEAFRRGPIRAGPDDLFTLRAIKVYADGALGSRGAHLKAPYSDDPHNTGLVLTSMKRDRGHLPAGARRRIPGLHPRHRGRRQSRRARGLCPRRRHSGRPVPHRARADPRPGGHSALLSTRCHRLDATDPRHERHALGREAGRPASGSPAPTPGDSLLDAGVHLAFGSDFPVELSDPRLGLFASLTRTDLQGQPPGGWLPEQRLTVEETLTRLHLGSGVRCLRGGVAWRAPSRTGRGPHGLRWTARHARAHREAQGPHDHRRRSGGLRRAARQSARSEPLGRAWSPFSWLSASPSSPWSGSPDRFASSAGVQRPSRLRQPLPLPATQARSTRSSTPFTSSTGSSSGTLTPRVSRLRATYATLSLKSRPLRPTRPVARRPGNPTIVRVDDPPLLQLQLRPDVHQIRTGAAP